MEVKRRIYLDANILIAAFENPGAHSDHAWWILYAIEDSEISAVTSEMTLAEILVKPIELGDAELAKAYEDMVATTTGFEVLPVRRDILIEAARLRARYRSIKLPDAIHLATAMAAKCSHVVSDDRRLPPIEGIKVLNVDPFTVDDILTERQ